MDQIRDGSRRALLRGGLTLGAAGALAAPLVAAATPAIDGATFDVKSFGATGEGVVSDRAAIQAAVDQAIAAGGGAVVFPPGDYLIGELEINVTGHNLRFVGFGRARLLLAEAAEDHVLVVRGSTSIVIEHLIFEYLGSIKKQGIAIQNSSRVTVRNCEFRLFRRYGISVSADDDTGIAQPCDDITITACVFEDIGTVGVNFFPKVPSSNVAIIGNKFRRCGNNEIGDQDGVAIKPGQFANGAICSDNLIDGCRNGIGIGNWGSLQVCGNVIVNPIRCGISIGATPHDSFSGASYTSLLIHGNTISNSDPALNAATGISIAGSGAANGPIEIAENQVTKVRFGFYFRCAGPVPNVLVRNNTFSMMTYGCRITSEKGGTPVRLLLQGNRFLSSPGLAMKIELEADGLIIAGCQFEGCDSVRITAGGWQPIILARNTLLSPRALRSQGAMQLMNPGAYRLLGNMGDNATDGSAQYLIDNTAAPAALAAHNYLLPPPLAAFTAPAQVSAAG